MQCVTTARMRTRIVYLNLFRRTHPGAKVGEEGRDRVHEVFYAMDCGVAMVNRSAFMAAEAQNEGGNRPCFGSMSITRSKSPLSLRFLSSLRNGTGSTLVLKEDKPLKKPRAALATSSCHDYLRGSIQLILRV
jgi:hypothetical protein